MTEALVQRVRRLMMIGLIGLVLPTAALASQSTLTVAGLEQGGGSSSWDFGSLTVTINGYSESVSFGQFSTKESVAAGLAAKFSQDCHSPVLAKAVGATITFSTKRSADAIYETSSAPVWDSSLFSLSSFDLAHASQTGGTVTPSLTVSCAPNPIPSGSPVDCTAQLPAGVTGTVVFTMDTQPSWASSGVDNDGWAPASTLSGLSVGTHTLHAAYSGDSHYNATSQSLTVPVLGGPLASSPVYQYAINSQLDGLGTAGYAVNGNILFYADSVNGQWGSPAAPLGYDNLNRLVGAKVVPVLPNPTQYFCWAYDSFGNRKASLTSTAEFSGGICPSSSQSGVISTYDSSNHINNDVMTVYDTAGNVQADGQHYYQYDGDGRVCAVGSRASGGMVGYQYVYDADGSRVAKGTYALSSPPPLGANGVPQLSCDTTTNGFTPTNSYVVDQGGDQVTEMTISNGQVNWAHTNVFAGGMLLATYDPQGLHFQIADWLGSRRVQTNAFGQVEENCQNLPFGDGLNCSYPSGAPATADDATEHHFTGKERDAESGLDYFGARYYSSGMGRWMSPDWSAKEEPVPYAKLDNPQSLNLYSYVFNNPLSKVDADGHDGCGSGMDSNGFAGCAAFGNHPLDRNDAKVLGGVVALWGGALARGAWALGSTALGFLASNPQIVQHANEMLQDAASPPGSPSVWSMGWAARGAAIESQLGGNLPAAFPTIDRFVQGEATSIKSLDLNASSYQTGGRLLSTVEGYIDKVAAFQGGQRGGTVIQAGQITGRELQLAVPGAGTAAQQAALSSASAYAQKQGVKLTVTQVH